MTWVVHSSWLERQFDGTQALDLDAAVGGATINLGIVTESSINADTNSLYSGLTPVATGTEWTGPITLTNISCGLDGSFNLIFDADDPDLIALDAVDGFLDGRSMVLYESTSSRILAHHTEPSTFGNAASPIDINVNAGGFFAFAI